MVNSANVQSPSHLEPKDNSISDLTTNSDKQKGTAWQCPLTRASLKSTQHVPGDSTDAVYRAAAKRVGSLLEHVVDYSPLENKENVLYPDVVVTADLEQSYIPFRPSITHFFSCSDGRADYALMGTPGGDLAEFVIAMILLEQANKNGAQLDDEAIYYYFQDYLEWCRKGGKEHLYYHSDTAAMFNWGKFTSVRDPLSPLDPDDKDRLIESASMEEHVGCDHLRAMVADPEKYGTRPAVVKSAIRAFFKVYFDPSHPSKPMLLFHVLKGGHRETAVVQVGHSENYGCGQLSPLVVPSSHGRSVYVNHRYAAELARSETARYLAEKLQRKADVGEPEPQVDPAQLFGLLQDVAQRHHEVWAKTINNMPSYEASYLTN